MTGEIDLVGMYRQMLRIRRFEERCAELYAGERIRGFVHLCVGQEAVAAGVIGALDPDDAVVATYREHGHALAKGIPMDALMAEMLGRASGVCRGRGGSMHLFDAQRRLYGGHAIVAAGLPLAVGLALGEVMQQRRRVTACFFGEGAMAEGAFHESMNLAALWHLPVLFCCENNRYAMGTSLERSQSSVNLALRASSYAMTSWACDGMDARAVRQAADRAVAMIRAGDGPVFLEAQTYRFRAHSMYDPDRYRDKAEIEQWKERDPLRLLGAALHESGAADWEAVAAIDAAVSAEVDAAVEFAEASAPEPVEDLMTDVTSAVG
ncbi:MAG: pyruvate dehydrogenase (acetyl-transferring) E1 component subunit alpha [Actinomycetales bacterium]|nr:pyruvate dehydrogenase (acetyl-transferring) E1 component subunit alpha [Actinomycetales bacterium]